MTYSGVASSLQLIGQWGKR